MKSKIILLSFSLFLVAGIGFAQKKGKDPKSIISDKVTISKYHNKEELEHMQKGELIGLYEERNQVYSDFIRKAQDIWDEFTTGKGKRLSMEDRRSQHNNNTQNLNR